MVEINNDEYVLLKNYLQNKCGLEIPEIKKYLFNTRLCEILSKNNFNSFSELYLNLKNGNSSELQQEIIENMTTSETSFFRDNHPFEVLKNKILPEISGIKKEKNYPRSLRIWSVACSTGQEPYSMAMIIKEQIENLELFNYNEVCILSTDISKTSIEKAKKGLYTEEEIKKGMKEPYKNKYLAKQKNNMWKVNNEIRKMIEFRTINLCNYFPDEFNKYDIILCRNVIIYFAKELKQKILDLFYKLLYPDGILIIGAAENLYNLSNNFEAEHINETTIYRIKK